MQTDTHVHSWREMKTPTIAKIQTKKHTKTGKETCKQTLGHLDTVRGRQKLTHTNTKLDTQKHKGSQRYANRRSVKQTLW